VVQPCGGRGRQTSYVGSGSIATDLREPRYVGFTPDNRHINRDWIGRAVAEELAREGCDVAMVARTEDALRRAADDIALASGRRVLAVPADASVPEAIINAIQQASLEFGGSIDILVNNAGSTPEDGIDHVDFAKWQYSIALKQFGYARFAQLVLPAMRAQKWGRIVNVIGRSGHTGRDLSISPVGQSMRGC